MFSKTRETKPHPELFSSEPKVKPSSSPSIVDADFRILGDVSSNGDVEVEGRIEGNVTCRKLKIGTSGIIRGDIMAEEVVVSGTIDGGVKAKMVNLTRSASVTGDIEFGSLGIEQGAFFEGNIKRLGSDRTNAEVTPANIQTAMDQKVTARRA